MKIEIEKIEGPNDNLTLAISDDAGLTIFFGINLEQLDTLAFRLQCAVDRLTMKYSEKEVVEL